MKKIIILMILFVLINNVSAGTKTQGEDCNKGSDCYPTWPYCVGNQNHKVCSANPGKLGQTCPPEDSLMCETNLKCVNMPYYGWVCSECAPGDYSSGGLSWQSHYTDGTVYPPIYYTSPTHKECLETDTACICDYVTGTNLANPTARKYGTWSTQGTQEHDGCSSNKECETGVCVNMQDSSNTMCIEEGSGENCKQNPDCYPTRECIDFTCVIKAAPVTTLVGSTTSTTTTLIVPTTTLPSGSTTTTLPHPTLDIDCEAWINVTQSSDDGYILKPYNPGAGFGIPVTGYITNEGLVLYNKSTNTNGWLNLTFRNLPFGFNAQNLNAELVLYTKYVPSETFNFTYYKEHGGNPTNELGLTTAQIPLFTGFDESTIEPYDDTPAAPTDFPAPGIIGNGTLIGNETYFSFDVSNNLLNQLEYYRNNIRYRYNSNVTLNVQITPCVDAGCSINGVTDLSSNFEVYSYDDDPDYSPRVCVYNITYRDRFDECQIDTDCKPNEYCETGQQLSNLCTPKQEDYTINKNSLCYRNHECLSGKCTTHNQNIWDYPTYTPYRNPYEYQGQCLPPTYLMDITTSPQILGISENFKVYVSTRTPNGIIFTPSECHFYFDKFVYDNLKIVNKSWGYSDENPPYSWQWNFSHTMNERPGEIWNFVNKYSVNVSKFADEGEHLIFSECTTADQITSVKSISVFLSYTNRTKIKYLSQPIDTPILNSEYNYYLQFLNYKNVPITGATCLMEFEGHNTTLEETTLYYKTKITFNETGARNVRFWCDKTDYDGYYDFFTYEVLPRTCNNGYQDNGEEGIDCGGVCANPCTPVDEDKKDQGTPCTYDIECKSNYCDIYDNICTIKCLNTLFKCGGACPQCTECITTNECATDGSAICNNTGQCQNQTCTDDSDCPVTTIYDDIKKTTYTASTVCDTDGLCRFKKNTDTNQTQRELSLIYTPLSHLQVDKPEGLLSVFNCDDKNNGFTIDTGVETDISYTFASSSNEPSIPSSYVRKQFGETGTKTKTAMIPELCEATKDIRGGFSIGEDSKYATIRFLIQGVNGKTITEDIEVITFKNSLKNDLTVVPGTFTAGEKNYVVNATNRTIQVWGRANPAGAWLNLTTGHQYNVLFDQRDLSDEMEVLGSFYLRINSSYGEIYEYRKTDSIPMLLTWDEDTQWFKLNESIKFEGWMIYVIIAFVIVLTAYYNYKTRRLGGE